MLRLADHIQSLLKKMQNINQVSCSILIKSFDELAHSAYNKCSVISELTFADVDDIINLELSTVGAQYHLGFSSSDDFQEISEGLSTYPSMRDFFKNLWFIELGECTSIDMPDKQCPDKVKRFCFINNRMQTVSAGLNPSLNGLGILNAVKLPTIGFTAIRICDVCRDVPSEKLKQIADMLLFLIIS